MIRITRATAVPMVEMFKDTIGTKCARLPPDSERIIKGDKECQYRQVLRNAIIVTSLRHGRPTLMLTNPLH